MNVLITGVSSGIGRDTTKEMIRRGHSVWGVARRRERLDELAGEVNSSRLHVSACDVSEEAQLQALCDELSSTGFAPDAVVLNAAVEIEEPMPALSGDVVRNVLRTDLEGPMLLTALLLEDFLRRGSGQFLAMGSLFENWPDRSCVSYSASKAGLTMFFRGLRVRYRGSGLPFKVLHLGPVATGINPRFASQAGTGPWWVVSSARAARAVCQAIEGSREDVYYPFYVGCVMRGLSWLPDPLFDRLTKGYRR